MTHEQRLDRLERIARLMVRAGLRARREMRQQDDKITIMIDAQIKNEDRFADLSKSQQEQDDKITIMIDAQIKNEDRFADLSKSQADLSKSQKKQDDKITMMIDAQLKNEERFAKLAESQKNTDRILAELTKSRNGKSR